MLVELPDQIQALIMSYLPVREIFLQLPLVSKRFSQLVKRPFFVDTLKQIYF